MVLVVGIYDGDEWFGMRLCGKRGDGLLLCEVVMEDVDDYSDWCMWLFVVWLLLYGLDCGVSGVVWLVVMCV